VQLRRVIERIVSKVGRRIDESSPFVDARLADGSRVNAVIPPLAVDGSSLTIRKFAREPFAAHDLIQFGTLSADIAAVLDACGGSGNVSELLVGMGVTPVLVDVSPEMLGAARRSPGRQRDAPAVFKGLGAAVISGSGHRENDDVVLIVAGGRVERAAAGDENQTWWAGGCKQIRGQPLMFGIHAAAGYVVPHHETGGSGNQDWVACGQVRQVKQRARAGDRRIDMPVDDGRTS